jgi:isocitrate dehydrogenase (NAD+)
MKVIVLPGDGIGPAVIREAVRVLKAVEFPGELEERPFGLRCWEECGEALPSSTLDAIRVAGVALLGAATSPAVGPSSPILALRRALDLDLMVRPVRDGPVDAVVLGAEFEGLYAEPEDPGPPARASWVLSEAGADRLLEAAFARARRRVTVVDKPTVLRGAARLFREAAARHARPGIDFELLNADAFVAKLVREPGTPDVVAATSFIADLLSDLLAGLAGGVGTVASASLSTQCAVFEPVHGSAPRHAAVRPAQVNPEGAIRAAAMLLDHVGLESRGHAVREGLTATLAQVSTRDRGGTAITEEFGRAVAAASAEAWSAIQTG